MILAQLPIDEAGIDPAGPATDPIPVLEALDCLRVAVTLYDRDERLIYLNRHFRYVFRRLPPTHALIGRSYEELVRMELDSGEIDPCAYPDGEDAFIAARRAQMAIGEYAPRDIRMTDGRIVEIKMRNTTDGGWIALWSDVTHAREAYSRLETAIEMSADAFAFWDREDRLVMYNPDFAVLHGSRPDERLAGITFAQMIHSVVARGMVKLEGPDKAWIEKRLMTHHAPAGAVTVAMANGKAYLVRERAMRDGGRATVYTDVTDHHRTEAAFTEQSVALKATRHELTSQANYLADLIKRLDAAEQGAASAKTTFLRTMSHELKTPLNAIIGFSDLLQSAPHRFNAEQIGEYAGLIHRAGGNLLTMLNQILDLTKIAAGRYPVTREATPLRPLLERAHDMVAETAENKSIHLVIEECPHGLAIDGDENALAQMLIQLAKNAVAFTHNGGTVRFVADEAGRRVRIRIEDDGPGVDAADLQRIVEPFEQVGRDTAAHNGGAGLGLPLVKALAELQGGTLTLESMRGEGFAAILDMPAA